MLELKLFTTDHIQVYSEIFVTDHLHLLIKSEDDPFFIDYLGYIV